MSFMGKLMLSLQTGLHTGFAAARRVFEDPSQAHQHRTWMDLRGAYSLLWAYYDNSIFDAISSTLNMWAAYKSNYSLYRNIRPVYNPTRRLVDFYAGQVYPGVLSTDATKLPEGIPIAIPFAADTPPELLAAIGQFWTWSNWQARKSVEIRYGGALGSVLVEVVDDIERGKVTANIPWPGFIAHLELDTTDNVKAYALQYIAYDEQENQTYTYRKEVDGTSFRTFKNDQLASEDPNIYGFVPAIWIKHYDTGSDQGSPAVAGSLGKIDELNNTASHVNDQIHKVIGAPSVLWSSGGIRSLFETPKRGETSDFPQPTSDQESLLLLKGPADGHVDSLVGNLDLAGVAAHMDTLLKEIEKDHPELTVFEELRSMSQVTGPAAERLVAPAISRLLEASANYDRGNIALFQMACAIGGMRANSGAWGALNRQQQKFLPFNLDSYTRGDLDLEILPRRLLIPTKYEKALEKQAMWTGVGQAVTAGVPLEAVLRDEGWTEEQLASLGQAQVDKIKRDQMLAQQDVIPTVGQ
jgi:hypothetical protein